MRRAKAITLGLLAVALDIGWRFAVMGFMAGIVFGIISSFLFSSFHGGLFLGLLSGGFCGALWALNDAPRTIDMMLEGKRYTPLNKDKVLKELRAKN
jgi:fructose-specific phosphotransferase system IIC component